VKDPGALESAVHRPRVARVLYPSVLLAGAAVVHSLNCNHAFHNGNKRTSLIALAIFLEDLNGRYLDGTEDELYELIVGIASHKLVSTDDSPGKEFDPFYSDREVLEVFRRLRRMVHTPATEDRALKWREFTRILERFSCVVDPLVSNQAKIRRSLPDGRMINEVAGARNAGDEISAIQVRQYRKKLELTDEFGIDSGVFYDGREPHPELLGLIRRYRGVLERLSLFDRT